MLVDALTVRIRPGLCSHAVASVNPFTVTRSVRDGPVTADVLNTKGLTVIPLTRSASDALGTVFRLASRMLSPGRASVPTKEKLIERFAILDLVTCLALLCRVRIAFVAMSLERTALRAMSSRLTLLRPGSALAVPARATHSARKATIIAGDGRCRIKRLMPHLLLDRFKAGRRPASANRNRVGQARFRSRQAP